VKAVDSHRHGLEPFLDVVPLAIVELTAQRTPSQGSQIAASINQKLGVGDIVFLGEAMEERRRGISPAAAEHVDFQQQLRFRVDGGVQPLFVAVDLDLLLVDGDPRRRRRRGSSCVSASFSFQFQTASTSRTDNPIE